MTRLFEPMRIGKCNLEHLIVMAPMTRLRADDEHVPTDIMTDYYSQRASVPGTLIITESNFISARSQGRHDNAPGIYTRQHIEHWARICDAVHRQGSYIFAQLWHVGRAGRPETLAKAGLEMVSSSDLPISEQHGIPRPMTEEEILTCIRDFGQAARNAVAAGFDGVEIHAANGYLIDQFTQDVCNRRTDRWGGSIENRSRFCLEVATAVCEAIGPERTGLRLSPFSDFQGMRMKDPKPQFTHLISHLAELNLAYLHLIEPRVSGNVDRDPRPHQAESLEFARLAWRRVNPLILAGGFTPATARKAVDGEYKDEDVAIAFGRHFISNPDLPFRIRHDVALAPYNRDTFYKVKSPDGYIDYPFCESYTKSTGKC